MPRKNLPDKVRRARKRDVDPDADATRGGVDPGLTLAAPPGWTAKMIQPVRAQKIYKCPGCNHDIREGVAHVVAWRPDDEAGRRHWHRNCFDIAVRSRKLV